VANKNDIRWVRPDVFKNSVSLPVFVWEHVEKHAFDKFPANEEHIYQTIINPDHAHRSLDPFVMGEGCIFEKFFEPEQQRFLVPVIYEGVIVPEEYELGGKKGRVLTGYFPGKSKNSSSVGEIFWSNPALLGDKDSE
jgi:hypothetical protein